MRKTPKTKAKKKKNSMPASTSTVIAINSITHRYAAAYNMYNTCRDYRITKRTLARMRTHRERERKKNIVNTSNTRLDVHSI